MYFAAPVTFSRPSLRSTLRPTALAMRDYRAFTMAATPVHR
jgi:hypothetical protein